MSAHHEAAMTPEAPEWLERYVKDGRWPTGRSFASVADELYGWWKRSSEALAAAQPTAMTSEGVQVRFSCGCADHIPSGSVPLACSLHRDGRAVRVDILATAQPAPGGQETPKCSCYPWEGVHAVDCRASRLQAIRDDLNNPSIAELDARIAEAYEQGVRDTLTGWQPIATAPDATYVLVWLPNYGANIATLTKHPTGDHWWMRDHSEYCYPTHWQPLPAPPAQEPR